MTLPKHEAIIRRAYRLYLDACHAAGLSGKPWDALDEGERWCWFMEAWLTSE